MPLNSPSYIERGFELRVQQEVLSGRWVLLLGPRQHGKTSALIRVREALRNAGLPCAYVDLQRCPPVSVYREYLAWFASRLASDLGHDAPLAADVETDDLGAWLAAAVGDGASPVVCIIDEASAVPAVWRNIFYGQLRAIANEAAIEEAPHLATRLRCVFAGTFRPETLVDDLNSPFNVCQRVETDDLSLEDAQRLWTLIVGPEEGMARVAYDDLGGQPYLLQKVMDITSHAEGSKEEALVDALRALRSGLDDHFEGVFGRVFAETNLAEAVKSMVRDGSAAMSPADADSKYLQTIGVARRDGRRLVFRNDIYRDFAAASPQLVDNTTPVPTAGLIPIRLLGTAAESFGVVVDLRLREFAEANVQAATLAYNAGAFRPALVGFGAALEALLVDFLTARVSSADLATAVAASSGPWWSSEDQLRPITWRLVNLIKVARQVPKVTLAAVDPPDGLREWRNHVHPGVALEAYRDGKDLEPEARTASGLLAGLLRDLT